MFWRRLLFAYIWFWGTVLWLQWAVLQTIFKGKLNHPFNKSQEIENYTRNNCFTWSLWKWLNEGGCLIMVSSPRLPVWRTLWARRLNKGPLWHFEPAYPKTGIKGIWHSYYHLGKPKDIRNEVNQ